MPAFRIRPALARDRPAMLAALRSSLANSPFHNRCFPPSDPTSQQQYVGWIEKNMNDPTSHVIIAEEDQSTGAAAMAGWARWVRRPTPAQDAKPLAFTPEMYPPNGDPRFAAHVFQTNFDAMNKAIGSQPVWFLSMLIVPEEWREKGVARALMRYGLDKADEDGWAAFGNASDAEEGSLALYECEGFAAADKHEFDGGLVTRHMMRQARR